MDAPCLPCQPYCWRKLKDISNIHFCVSVMVLWCFQRPLTGGEGGKQPQMWVALSVGWVPRGNESILSLLASPSPSLPLLSLLFYALLPAAMREDLCSISPTLPLFSSLTVQPADHGQPLHQPLTAGATPGCPPSC